MTCGDTHTVGTTVMACTIVGPHRVTEDGQVQHYYRPTES